MSANQYLEFIGDAISLVSLHIPSIYLRAKTAVTDIVCKGRNGCCIQWYVVWQKSQKTNCGRQKGIEIRLDSNLISWPTSVCSRRENVMLFQTNEEQGLHCQYQDLNGRSLPRACRTRVCVGDHNRKANIPRSSFKKVRGYRVRRSHRYWWLWVPLVIEVHRVRPHQTGKEKLHCW